MADPTIPELTAWCRSDTDTGYRAEKANLETVAVLLESIPPLEAENARLREALERIRKMEPTPAALAVAALTPAGRAALEEQNHER